MRIALFGAGGMLATALTSQPREHTFIEIPESVCDITQPEQVERVLRETEPQAIINAAAYTNVDGAETNEALAMAVNGEAVGTIARVAKDLGVPLVHISTDYVFDGENRAGYQEDSPRAPQNAYGRTKARGEELLEQSGADYYLVRTAWLYGPNGKNFVDTILKLAATKPELGVINDQTGSPTYTRDLAAAMFDLLEQRPPFGVYHRTNDGTTTWYGFTQEIFRLAHVTTPLKPLTTSEYPLPARRPHYSVLRSTKLPPLRAWQDALAAYLKEKSS